MSETATVTYRKDYQPPVFLCDQITLLVDVFADHTRVRAEMALRRHQPGSTEPLILNGEALDSKALAVDGRPLSPEDYHIEDNTLRIDAVGDQCHFTSEVHLRPQDNSALSGFYQSGETLCSQCEAEGFRRITWSLDRPDVLSRYHVTMTADQQTYPVLLSNGNRLSEQTLADGRHQVVWEDPHPKPSYLFAMVAGKLDCLSGSYTTASGRAVRCEIWVEPGRRERAHHALASLQAAMRWDEEHYGREYDLDLYMIVAVSTFNMGAMENKGLNIFNDKFVLASNDTATDADFEGVEGVIAHEYFHNWTGNRITCRDWFQLTLKEGLTVFRDQQFSADRTSHPVKRIDEVRLLRNHQFPEDAGPMAHPIRPESYVAMDNFYTATVYNKGAEVIRMYHTLLGASGFRKGMDLYFQRHDGQAVTCDDFRAAMADANDRDFSQFARWYEQAGTPELHATTAFDAAAGTFRLTLRQEQPAVAEQPPGGPLVIPMRMGLIDRTGQTVPLRLAPDEQQAPEERVLELSEAEQSWTFYGLQGPPVASLLRDFSAPVRLHSDAEFADLTLLAAHDPDPFNRWQAVQDVAQRVLLEQVAKVQAGGEPEPSRVLEEVFAATLAADDLDPALKALALSLPSWGELADQLTSVPVDALGTVRRFHRQHLARFQETELLTLFEALNRVAASDRSVAARQQRRLRHACLAYLAAIDDRYLERAADYYDEAGNMSERMAALSALVDHDSPRTQQALAEFYQRFQGDDLVIDKWFSIQALADRADTLERVQELSQHPDFRCSNPNRVRSLYSALAVGNPAHFHRGDGLGYDLVGGMVRQLANRNPQLAARLCASFNQWKRFDPARQGLMRQQLEAIRTAEPSRDVREIVDRALG